MQCGYIKRKQRSLVSICNEYGNLFERAYRMDYPSFLELHELIKDGIEEYVRKEVTSTNSSANQPFYRKNGKITTQICLACALRYFAGGSYLDIIMSHPVGKMDLIDPFGRWYMLRTNALLLKVTLDSCLFLVFLFLELPLVGSKVINLFSNKGSNIRSNLEAVAIELLSRLCVINYGLCFCVAAMVSYHSSFPRGNLRITTGSYYSAGCVCDRP